MFHLHSLRITGAGFKLLRDGAELRIDDWQKPITVLIGENGSGKSTVLECLTWIFRALHERYVMERRDNPPPFEFELLYVISSRSEVPGGATFTDPVFGLPGWTEAHDYSEYAVRVTGHRTTAGKYELVMEQEEQTRDKKGQLHAAWVKVKPAEYARLAPNLVIYYSGLSASIEDIYRAFELPYRLTMRGDVRSSQDAYARVRVHPLYYHERGHFELLLAALYSFEYSDDIDEFLTGRLAMGKPANDCLRLTIRRKEYPGKAKTAANFWNADGELGIFLARVREYAATETENADKSLTFSFDLDGWYALRAQYGEERLLLTLLLLIQAEGLLEKLEVFYDLPTETHVSHLAMSEGQQQIITLRALNELMVGDNTLFLLDEPDTYLHPRWQAAFMEEIRPFSERASFLVTTHSPLLLANFKDGNLFAMKDGQARLIQGHYYGRTYEDNLRDVMHAETRPEEAQTAFLRLYDLLDRSAWDDADEQVDVLRDLVGPDDSELVQVENTLAFMRADLAEDDENEPTENEPATSPAS